MKTLLYITIPAMLAAHTAFSQQAVPAAEPAAPAAGLSVEEQISQHVRTQSEEEHAKRMEFMSFVIDDIARLCKLTDAQKERLTLAAKGASKRSMERWHEQAERYFRQRVTNTDEDTVSEVLQNMGNFSLGGRDSDREGETESIWKDSLKDVLTPEQITAYESVLVDRQKASVAAFSEMSISTLDNHLRLTPDQKAKLTPIIRNSTAEHLEDIQRHWGEYIEKNMLMSVANSADEETLKQILSEQQWQRLQAATSNLDHFWEQRRKVKNKPGDSPAKQAQAIRINGNIQGGGRIVIKAGNNGAVRIGQGAIFRGADIEIEAGEITIDE
jgi:hypothetical protein